MQGRFDNARQFRPIAASGYPQQLRQADIPHHGQPGELRLPRKATELSLVHHRVAGLLAQQQLQGLALQRHPLQVEVGVSQAQVIGHRTGHAHGDPGLAVEFFQLHRTCALALPDHQLRHAHIGVAEQPQAQTGRGLGQARGHVHLAVAQGPLQLCLVREVAPAELDVQRLGQGLHQLDIGPGQPLQAPVVPGERRLQHQPHPQLGVLRQPLALFQAQGRSRHLGRRGRMAYQGKAQTADKQKAAKTHHLKSHTLTNTDQPIRLPELLLAWNIRCPLSTARHCPHCACR